ncbi:methyltransferase FkbM family [Methanococcus vannielii SB]|uniref:Methyltransferase FkbM family n=1 Tax=Methanococcus vannielii (strain ATCC 35089 / DSM 1224 / JCM 13029 / OCM 148 / SB) TaxID=406327 RepID=A6UP91_METVS|nr:FkbM family methyltransferase [Methanococcus vannielii]ABR54313.1 methyltransferase FkbM family [Methanococcus vannielii SB]
MGKIINLFTKNIKLKLIAVPYIIWYKLKYPNLVIRKNTTDLNVFLNIFIQKELNLPVKLKPKYIIDAGAYAGYSSIYFHEKYPEAEIIAIEPEKSNFNTLVKNTNKIKQIISLNLGLWYKEAFLKVEDRKTGKWGFKVSEVLSTDEYDIKSTTIDNILDTQNWDKIDILKIDIEGSEKELFTKNSKKWINKVNVIVIELHDRINEGCTKALYSAINLSEWVEYKTGEKVILIRKNFI